MGQVRPSLISHWIVEGDHIDPHLLDNVGRVKRIIRRIIVDLGLHHVGVRAKHFGPGVTVVHLLAESHLSIHTWPEENGYLYADVATCSVILTRDQIGQAFSDHFKTQYLRIGKASP